MESQPSTSPQIPRMNAAKRFLGGLIMLASAVGLAISLFGLTLVAPGRERIERGTTESVALARAGLEGIGTSLAGAEGSIEQAASAMSSARDTAESVNTTLQDTGLLLDSLEGMLTEDIPGVIESTQASLETAEQSAVALETFLRALDTITFGAINYEPEVPLNESIAGISESLGALPESLADVEGDLSAAHADLEDVQEDLANLGDGLGSVEESLTGAQIEIGAMQTTIEDLAGRLSELEENLPGWIQSGALWAYFLLAWLAVSQIGLLAQGWEMATFNRRALEARLAALEEKFTR